MTALLEKVSYQSDAMQQIQVELGPCIETATPIFFWGETGSGMGFYAKAIHRASQRAGKFLTIPGFSLDEEATKRQFLGDGDQPGWLEDVDQGTIFIKRISEAPPSVQQLLCHLLGNQSVDGRLKFSRVGRTENLEVNVRFLYSMAHDFNMALQDELLYRELVEEVRKRGKIIHIPPLRERQEDILNIAANFFEVFNQKYEQNIQGINRTAEKFLKAYIWPGNVDELKHVIEQIASQHPDTDTITETHLPDHIKQPQITGDEYSFKFIDEVKFSGKFLSPLLKLQTSTKKVKINTGDVMEIVREEDAQFTPPKFKHFVFRLKDGTRLIGKILDKKMYVKTSFDSKYQVNPQDIDSVYLG